MVDNVLSNYVESIYQRYDTNLNGFLAVDEYRRFVKDQLSQSGSLQNFTEEEFLRTFRLFDVNGDGTISKKEMLDFLRRSTDFQ